MYAWSRVPKAGLEPGTIRSTVHCLIHYSTKESTSNLLKKLKVCNCKGDKSIPPHALVQLLRSYQLGLSQAFLHGPQICLWGFFTFLVDLAHGAPSPLQTSVARTVHSADAAHTVEHDFVINSILCGCQRCLVQLHWHTPPIAEILCVQNGRAIVVCGFLIKYF